MPSFTSIRSFALPIASAMLFLGVLTVPLTRADDPPAPANVVATLKGHTESVYSTAFTPDGKYVVTGSFDKTIKVWDAATGKEFKTLRRAERPHRPRPQRRRQPRRHAHRLRRLGQHRQDLGLPHRSTLSQSLRHADAVNAVAVSPDGKKVAGAGKDGLVKLWNAADGKELFSLAGHAGAVLGVAFSANGQLLVSCGADKTLRFWNPATTAKPVAVVGAHTGPVTAVALNPNGNAAYSAGDDGVLKFWTLPPTPARALAAPHGDAVTALALSADGNQILTGSADKTRAPLHLRQRPAGPRLRRARRPPSPRSPLAAPRRGRHGRQRLFLWNAADGKLDPPGHGPRRPRHRRRLQRRRRRRCSRPAATACSNCGRLPAAPTRVLTHPDAVTAAAVGADGKHVFTAGADKMVRSWDAAKPQQPERQFYRPPHGRRRRRRQSQRPAPRLGRRRRRDPLLEPDQRPAGRNHRRPRPGRDEPVLRTRTVSNSLSASADGGVKVWQLPARGAEAVRPPRQGDGRRPQPRRHEAADRLRRQAGPAVEPGHRRAGAAIPRQHAGGPVRGVRQRRRQRRGRRRRQVADRLDRRRRQGGEAVRRTCRPRCRPSPSAPTARSSPPAWPTTASTCST